MCDGIEPPPPVETIAPIAPAAPPEDPVKKTVNNNTISNSSSGNSIINNQQPPNNNSHTTNGISQGGTQAGRRPRPPLLRHHASEMVLTARLQRAAVAPAYTRPHHPTVGFCPVGSVAPFYTTRSGHPYDTLYSATRVRKRLQPYSQPYNADSPTNSLDYLPLKATDWSPASLQQHARMNGISGASSHSCRCSCHGGNEEHDKPNSRDTLSWRRLHMSRAKLKATATTSELLSGFAMIAMVELQINEPTNVPEWLFVMFAVCTTVLVAVHIFALMISTYLLPNIDAASKMSAGDVLKESPHERMRGFIELAWAFSTVLGLFLFLVEIAILCWVKFWDYSFAAATAATVIVIPVLIVFVAFAIHFYHSLVVHKYESSNEDIEQLENMKRNLDSATITANSPV